ncbi:hypothetical protein CLV96_1028 [Leptospira meyeri]|uniref:DUF7661 domain-containing protein n=1 Tax=Leptospira meyeri TaxID=29508 RepID=A0A4R8MW92_LEPME|nr:hypothetical protein [Leptospira meyeri]EKJ84863.1 hypothetical protein LEP1GSC017_2928 [Leptospira meyeri serovar Hardjo str. Went 5]TDY72047.1 hypothetical protein CLV96_1028 [Leptospira meyeri]
MEYYVYRKKIIVEREKERWIVFYSCNDGKRRVAEDIYIPSEVKKENLLQYLEDLLHEWASQID